MPSLMDLFPEILEEVVMKLESVEDVISLGSSCTDLTRTVGQERIWRFILSKTELVEEDGEVKWDRVYDITTFLSSLDDNNPIFSLLHQEICRRYPATDLEDNITVSFPEEPHSHRVSVLGLELLAVTSRGAARYAIKVGRISPSLIFSLASLHQSEEITELVVTFYQCQEEEEGAALASLLERCTSWRVEVLHLSGQVAGQTWARLAREVVRGRLEDLETDLEVVKRGRRDDLIAVWGITEGAWFVEEEDFWKKDGEQEGLWKIEKMIQ